MIEQTLVEQLRGDIPIVVYRKMCRRAAKEIERLQAEVELLNEMLRERTKILRAVRKIDNQREHEGHESLSDIVLGVLGDSLSAVWDGLQLRWSDEPPTEPGFYFYRYPGMREKMRFVEPGDIRLFKNSETFQWAGPIPKPTEPEIAGS